MRIASINNNYNINTSFYNSNKNISFCKSFEYINSDVFDDVYEQKTFEEPETFSESVHNDISSIYNRLKTSLWLSVPAPTKRSLKAFFDDPEAYTYELNRNMCGKVTNKEILAEIELDNRSNHNNDKAVLRKVDFDDCSSVFVIQQGHDKLGFLDVIYEEDDNIFVNYASTVGGRKEYRNLLMMLIQGLVEDYIVNYKAIPSIEAEAAQIGNMNFSRASLYKYYGAEVNKKCDGHVFYDSVSVSKEKVEKFLNIIENSPKRKFILPETPIVLDNLEI